MNGRFTVLRRSPLIVSLVVAALVQVVILAIDAVALGIPEEWVWQRHAFPDSLLSAAVQFAPALFGVTGLLFIAQLGNGWFFRHHRRCIGDEHHQRRGPGRAVTGLLLLLLVTASWVWLKTVQRCTPDPHRSLKSLWVLYDPSASGYFFEAAFKMESAGTFLSTYEARMAEGEVYHVGTHPPGLFLLSRATIGLCRVIPGPASLVRYLSPREDVEAFRRLEREARLQRPLGEAELTALCLLSELTTLAAALSVIPLYYLTRRCFSALVAWRVACLWATLPCLAVFLSKSDVLFTFTSASSVALGVTAIASVRPMGQRLVMAAGSGVILWCGLMMSLAHLPVAALLGAVCGIRILRQWMTSAAKSPVIRRSVVPCLLVFATILATVALAAGLFSLLTSCDLLTVWRLNLKNHGAFYDQHTRTAWKWLLVNPLELSMAIGMPMAVAVICGLHHCLPGRDSGSSESTGTLGADVSIAVATTIGLLWLSCRNSGEAARLWCFMTPWLLVIPGHLIRAEVQRDAVLPHSKLWLALLLIQMLVCIVTTGRVNGFSI